ncbi:MAG: 50S ribosomal protein L21 [Candidatus Eremiobacteraeota bacterium]|nr:50S ribosomal protein L21 [Candidatus Eremiobacteraeota bacterium]
MYAIIETGGKQFRVSEGDVIRTDLIETEVGTSVTFDRVLLAGTAGGDVSVGSPLVAGAAVTGTVLRQAKDKKILVFKYKPKKRVRKLTGHRQRFAEVRIDRIALAASG